MTRRRRVFRTGSPLALIAALALAGTAQAVTLQRINGAPIPRLQHIIDHAPVPTAPGIVHVRYVGHGGTWYTNDRTIIVGKRGLDSGTLMHELGHDYDRHMLTDQGFAMWSQMVGQRMARDTIAQIYTPDQDDPGSRMLEREFFADWYAGCATRGDSVWGLAHHRLVTDYGLVLSERRFRSSCRRVWRLPAVFDPTVTQ